ncbi:MAG TPA: acyltransferase family protein [Micromonosporaceae bacterium]
MADPSSAHPHRPGAYRYRPALDGVRALAVTAVLLFHGGVGWLPGGFLGVDAFFVLSGFLITSLLLAEHAATGRIRLAAFWGRRARRLLPALLVLLVAVALVGRDLLPPIEVGLLRGDALAALGYVANWRMIFRGSGYFAQTAAPSPLQHTWSLGIEEQFYLLWPLLVVALLRLRRSRGALLAVTLAGAAASAVAAASLYRIDDVSRAYFGTDSRAQALLIGCALAVLLHRTPTARPRHGEPPRRPVLGALALTGAVGTGWLWSHADGTSSWLYRGGLTVGALAVAAVVAHAVTSPASPTARLLALAPLVRLGRVSYGVYLWHWPLFQLVDADRTGLRGPPLLAVRCALTLVVAIASYLLVEQPIRRGRRIGGLPRPVPVGATVAAVAGTVVAIVLATAPTPAVSHLVAAPQSTLGAGMPSAPPTTGTRNSPPPDRRPGRHPGPPRIGFYGDSVAWTLAKYLPPQPNGQVINRAVQGCGIARLPDILELGTPHTNLPGCTTWDQRWRADLGRDDPDVAVILLDRWELMDRRLDGTYQHVGQPGYDAYLTRELDLAISIVGSRGATVVLLTAPYTHRAERPDGGLYPEDQPQRVDAWNALLRADAARHPRTTVVDLNSRVTPGGFTWSIQGLRVRSDGLHFTPAGVREWIAPWLMPHLWALATGRNG